MSYRQLITMGASLEEVELPNGLSTANYVLADAIRRLNRRINKEGYNSKVHYLGWYEMSFDTEECVYVVKRIQRGRRVQNRK